MTGDFVELPARVQDAISAEHFHHWHSPGGELVALFFRLPEGYLLRFPGRADFTFGRTGAPVTCVPTPEVSRNVLTALCFNQVIPLLHSLNGALVLHASASSGPSGALAFIGPSGRGKSTLAAALARAGHPFLTDDGVWIKRDGPEFLVTPNRAGLRLWPDSEIAVLEAPDEAGDWSEKAYRPSGPDLPFEDRSRRLAVLYVLGEGRDSGVAIERLRPTTAVVELVKYAFLLDAEDRALHRAHFDRIGQIAENVGCFRLDYPRRYGDLPRVIEAVLAHVEQEAAA